MCFGRSLFFNALSNTFPDIFPVGFSLLLITNTSPLRKAVCRRARKYVPGEVVNKAVLKWTSKWIREYISGKVVGEDI